MEEGGDNETREGRKKWKWYDKNGRYKRGRTNKGGKIGVKKGGGK